jgi:hypothetical protein
LKERRRYNMYKITANGNKPAHGVKQYLVETKSDLADIKLTANVASGSKAFAAKEDQWYVLDLNRQWVKMTVGGGSGGGGGGEDDPVVDPDNVVYEGGDL